tara:strand:- start:1286 stop:2722 length:1437 start_codon:yes stop_codon:yes gene_type:complete
MSLLAELRASGRQPPLPCEFELPQGHVHVLRWLRVLPGKRLVAEVDCAGQPGLLKLFIAGGAERHCQREVEGLVALEAQDVATPALYGHGAMPDGIHFVLTAYLDGARSLQQQWELLDSRAAGDSAAMTLLGRALALIADMHRKGLVQTDLHLGNFLLQEQQLYVIDGDAVQALSAGQPLSAEQVEDNLAIFLAQLDPEWDALGELLLVDYLQHNPLALNPDRLARQVTQVRQRRLNDYLSKTLRDCTAFAVRRTWRRFCVVVREELDSLSGLLARPDEAFDDQPLLKDGGSSTVARFTQQGRELVIKRYNIKSVAHWFKRFWRPSRAWHSWLAAHRLQFLGIATPAPLAMIEQRFGPLRHRAWLITDYCAGVDLLQHLGVDGQVVPSPQTADAMLTLFGQLVQARISHGDLKATNLLWYQGRVSLIDLDAMKEHRSDRSWQLAWQRDRQRFIRNWPQGSPLAAWLDERMPHATSISG